MMNFQLTTVAISCAFALLGRTLAKPAYSTYDTTTIDELNAARDLFLEIHDAATRGEVHESLYLEDEEDVVEAREEHQAIYDNIVNGNGHYMIYLGHNYGGEDGGEYLYNLYGQEAPEIDSYNQPTSYSYMYSRIHTPEPAYESYHGEPAYESYHEEPAYESYHGEPSYSTTTTTEATTTTEEPATEYASYKPQARYFFRHY